MSIRATWESRLGRRLLPHGPGSALAAHPPGVDVQGMWDERGALNTDDLDGFVAAVGPGQLVSVVALREIFTFFFFLVTDTRFVYKKKSALDAVVVSPRCQSFPSYPDSGLVFVCHRQHEILYCDSLVLAGIRPGVEDGEDQDAHRPRGWGHQLHLDGDQLGRQLRAVVRHGLLIQ